MSIYFLLKRVIEKGIYDKEDMLNKLDVYYVVGEISDEQFIELLDIVDPIVEDFPYEEDFVEEVE